MSRRPVPVDLDVVVVAIGRRVAREEQVVLQAVVRAGVVRLRVHRLDLPCDLADAIGRNHGVFEERAIPAIGRARGRIVYAEAGVERDDFTEIAVAHPCGRYGVGVEDALPLGVPFPPSEVEQFIAADGTANRAPHDRGARIDLARIEIAAAGVQLVLLAEVERGAPDGVGSRFCLDGCRRPARHALSCVEAVGRNVDVLDGFCRRDVPGVVRQPHVDAGGAIDPRHVVVAIRPVDVCRERAAGRVRLRVLEDRRRGPGDQVHQVLVVAVLIQGKVGDILRPQVDADVGFVRLEDGRFAGDRDRFVQRANVQAAVDADDTASRDEDSGLDELLEALQRGLQRVGATGDVSNRVSTGGVGHGRQLEARILVLDGDGRAGHGGVRGIVDGSGQASVKGLTGGRGWQQPDCGCQCHGHPRPRLGQTKTITREYFGFAHSSSSMKERDFQTQPPSPRLQRAAPKLEKRRRGERNLRASQTPSAIRPVPP